MSRDLAVEYVPVSALRESPINPRLISDRAVEIVALSISRFGWRQPLVVDSENVIVVGHTRYRAAKQLGIEKVPALVADDLTPEEIDAYRIADNRTRDFTSWDLPELTKQLDGLAAEFGDVLALADWETIVSDFAAHENAAAADLDLPDAVKDALDGGFVITAHFHSKDDALAAEAVIIDMPGAFDVRHSL